MRSGRADRWDVTGGTGGFVGANGSIHAHGTVVVGGDIEPQYQEWSAHEVR